MAVSSGSPVECSSVQAGGEDRSAARSSQDLYGCSRCGARVRLCPSFRTVSVRKRARNPHSDEVFVYRSKYRSKSSLTPLSPPGEKGKTPPGNEANRSLHWTLSRWRLGTRGGEPGGPISWQARDGMKFHRKACHHGPLRGERGSCLLLSCGLWCSSQIDGVTTRGQTAGRVPAQRPYSHPSPSPSPPLSPLYSSGSVPSAYDIRRIARLSPALTCGRVR